MEVECDINCGRFYPLIRSAIWSTTNAAENVFDGYKQSLKFLGKPEKIVEKKVAMWLQMTEENCDLIK